LFIAHLDLPAEASLSEFAVRLQHSVRFASSVNSVWANELVLRNQAILPLLRWSSADDSFSADWFAAHLSPSQDLFNSTRYDIEPEEVRLQLTKAAKRSRRS